MKPRILNLCSSLLLMLILSSTLSMARADSDDGIVRVKSAVSMAEAITRINADIAAGTIAGKLKAEKFIYLSDVPGIMRDATNRDSLIPSVSRAEIEQLMEDEIITGGMIPKVESAMLALGEGVEENGHRSHVHRAHAHAQHVGGDPCQLTAKHPQRLAAWWKLQTS